MEIIMQWDGNWNNTKKLRNDTPAILAYVPEDSYNNDPQNIRLLISDNREISIICEIIRDHQELKQAILDATSLDDLKDRVRNL